MNNIATAILICMIWLCNISCNPFFTIPSEIFFQILNQAYAYNSYDYSESLHALVSLRRVDKSWRAYIDDFITTYFKQPERFGLHHLEKYSFATQDTDTSNCISIFLNNNCFYIISGKNNGRLELLCFMNSNQKDLLRTEIFNAHTTGITAITSYIKDTNLYFATGYENGTVRLWGSTIQGTIFNIDAITHHSLPVSSLISFSYNNTTFLVSGSRDQNMNLFQIDENNRLFHLQKIHNAHDNWITGLASYTYNGYERFVVSTSIDKSIKLWSMNVKKELHPISSIQNAHDCRIDALAIAMWGKTPIIASGDHSGTIKMWYIEQDNTIQALNQIIKADKNSISSLQTYIINKVLYIISSTKNGNIKIWYFHESGQLKLLQSLSNDQANPISAIAMCSNAQTPYLASAATRINTTYSLHDVQPTLPPLPNNHTINHIILWDYAAQACAQGYPIQLSAHAKYFFNTLETYEQQALQEFFV